MRSRPCILPFFLFIFYSFLDNVSRIAARGYVPTDDDILHARLHTIGVQEYNINLPEPQAHPPEAKGLARVDPHFLKLRTKLGVRQWHIYDVGGSRNQVRISFASPMKNTANWRAETDMADIL